MRNIGVILFAVLIIGGVYAWSGAGQIDPSTAPAPTYADMSAVYDAIASAGYDSSAIASDSAGSAFGIAKCIIEKISGGSCP